MSALVLTADEKALLDAIDPLLDDAFADGVEYPAATQVLAPLPGYNDPRSRPHQAAIRAPFLAALVVYAREVPASGGKPAAPAITADDRLVWAGGGTANLGAEGTLALAPNNDYQSGPGLGLYESEGLWMPPLEKNGGSAESNSTSKGQESGAFTMWAWIYVPFAPTTALALPIFCKCFGGGWTNPFVDVFTFLYADLSLAGGAYLGGGIYSRVDSAAAAVTTNAWHLVAYGYDPAVGSKLYLDGVLVGSDLVHFGAIAWSTGPWSVGAECWPGGAGGYHTPALVGRVCLHRGLLTASELLAIFNAGTA